MTDGGYNIIGQARQSVKEREPIHPGLPGNSAATRPGRFALIRNTWPETHMTPREAVLAQIRHEETSPVPFTLTFEDEVGQRLDDFYGGPQWRERLTPYIVWAATADLMKWEPIDEAHYRDVYGGIWRTDARPFHLEKPPLDSPSLDGFPLPDASTFLDPELKQSAREAFKQNPDSFLVAMIGWGIWEKLWQLRGFENALVDSVADPDFFEEVLDKHTEIMLRLVDFLADLPADAIMFGEDWGIQQGVMLGGERWRKFLKPRWAKIYEAIHATGKLVISHCCGSVAEIMPDIVEIGLDVLESIQVEAAGMDPYELKRRWGDKITFWGALGSQSIIPFGKPDEIRAETRRLCREMGRCGGYILAPVKPLMPETPTENAVAIVEAFTNQE